MVKKNKELTFREIAGLKRKKKTLFRNPSKGCRMRSLLQRWSLNLEPDPAPAKTFWSTFFFFFVLEGTGWNLRNCIWKLSSHANFATYERNTQTLLSSEGDKLMAVSFLSLANY